MPLIFLETQYNEKTHISYVNPSNQNNYIDTLNDQDIQFVYYRVDIAIYDSNEFGEKISSIQVKLLDQQNNQLSHSKWEPETNIIQGTFTISLGLIIDQEDLPDERTDLRLSITLEMSKFGFDFLRKDIHHTESLLYVP
jgi:hypothetical protein